MSFTPFLDKHFRQIKSGGYSVFLKKILSFILLIFQSPIYLSAIPIVLFLYLIKPFFLIRLGELPSSRLGHFSMNVELYCCEKDAGINTPSQKHIDIFFLKKVVCNKQLEKMWRRKLIIFPRWLMSPINKVNIFLNKLIPVKKFNKIGPENSDRDIYNLLEKFNPHISFTNDEEQKAKNILKDFGIDVNHKFVCLLVRDPAYLDRHKNQTLRDFNYHNYRDADIDKYLLAAEELTKRGYYVFRMGAKVSKPMKSSNPKIIDYANTNLRSDFMDMYLGAKCTFCISVGGAGFLGVPFIFRKPNAYVMVPFGHLCTANKYDLMITKNHIFNKTKKRLNFSEIFSNEVAIIYRQEEFDEKDITLEENNPEEIRDLSIEMDDRLNGNWIETDDDLELQNKFWKIFSENIKKQNLKIPLHGKIKAKFCSNYLRKNKDLLK
jgi:putative glycosyltransferase (TIGR04372 family)